MGGLNASALGHNYVPEKPSVRHVTFHVTCLSIFVVVFNCHMFKIYGLATYVHNIDLSRAKSEAPINNFII